MRTCWICPLCAEPLHRLDGSWSCSQRHSFDIAREGYVNLLPAQYRKSRNPGDSAESITARRAFLSTGFYLPLSEAVAKQIHARITNRNNTTYILDCGCGEGSHTQVIAQYLNSGKKSHFLFNGIDISRAAVRAAARLSTNINYAVASGFRIPCADTAFDAVTIVFAPADPEEIHRILKPKGIIVNVTPGENHLLEIRQRLYDKVQYRPEKPLPGMLFELIDQEPVEFLMPTGPDNSLSNLLKMTPHFWKTAEEKRKPLLQMEKLDVTASFRLSVYRKR